MSQFVIKELDSQNVLRGKVGFSMGVAIFSPCEVTCLDFKMMVAPIFLQVGYFRETP